MQAGLMEKTKQNTATIGVTQISSLPVPKFLVHIFSFLINHLKHFNILNVCEIKLQWEGEGEKIRGKDRHLQNVSHLWLCWDKRVRSVAWIWWNQRDPEYLQREREGKQERPLGHCPVEGQTLEWERERKTGVHEKASLYRSEGNLRTDGEENSHLVLSTGSSCVQTVNTENVTKRSQAGTFSLVTVSFHQPLKLLNKNRRCQIVTLTQPTLLVKLKKSYIKNTQTTGDSSQRRELLSQRQMDKSLEKVLQLVVSAVEHWQQMVPVIRQHRHS